MQRSKNIFFIFLFLIINIYCSISFSQTLSNSGAVGNIVSGTVLSGGDINNTSGTISNEGTITISNFTNVGTINGNGNYNIAGNWENNGVFIPAAGGVTFSGTTNQTIGGTNETTFNKLTINNTSATGVTLTNPISVEGIFTLTNGFLYTSSTNLLTLNTGSSVGAVSNNSFVSGPMAKIGTTNFTFPVGKFSKYRPIGISMLTGSETFTAEYFDVDPNTVPYDVKSKEITLVNISRTEYWILNRTAAEHAFVTLSWDIYSGGITDIASLAVARWDGALWKDHGQSEPTGLPDPGTGTITTLALVTSFIPFTIGSRNSNNHLPITLLNFTAKRSLAPSEKNVVAVKWSTASEINNDYFNVERSTDAINFTSVSKIKGAGNSKQILNYSAFDKAALDGVSYYRLKQTDYDGRTSFSKVETVQFDHINDLITNIYPNPNDGDTFYLQINNNSAEVLVAVNDMLGKELYSTIIDTSKSGNDIYIINLPQQLNPGAYLITATANNKTYTKRLIVINYK
jgi:hypothetical protein